VAGVPVGVVVVVGPEHFHLASSCWRAPMAAGRPQKTTTPPLRGTPPKKGNFALPAASNACYTYPLKPTPPVSLG
ncbi:MAG TPA: hypothetical protein PKC70_11075, partial [Cellvibrionaceae bacterium]|nr:hypothetical protein [Cellvibrionaceae bacterium]